MRRTTITCDGCGENLGSGAKPLLVSVVPNPTPTPDAFYEFCSFACAGDWMYRQSHELGEGNEDAA